MRRNVEFTAGNGSWLARDRRTGATLLERTSDEVFDFGLTVTSAAVHSSRGQPGRHWPTRAARLGSAGAAGAGETTAARSAAAVLGISSSDSDDDIFDEKAKNAKSKKAKPAFEVKAHEQSGNPASGGAGKRTVGTAEPASVGQSHGTQDPAGLGQQKKEAAPADGKDGGGLSAETAGRAAAGGVPSAANVAAAAAAASITGLCDSQLWWAAGSAHPPPPAAPASAAPTGPPGGVVLAAPAREDAELAEALRASAVEYICGATGVDEAGALAALSAAGAAILILPLWLLCKPP
jgi:hypothetical protein